MEQQAALHASSWLDCVFAISKHLGPMVMFMDAFRLRQPMNFDVDPEYALFLLVYLIILAVIEFSVPFHDKTFYKRDFRGRIVPKRVPRPPLNKFRDPAGDMSMLTEVGGGWLRG